MFCRCLSSEAQFGLRWFHCPQEDIRAHGLAHCGGCEAYLQKMVDFAVSLITVVLHTIIVFIHSVCVYNVSSGDNLTLMQL